MIKKQLVNSQAFKNAAPDADVRATVLCPRVVSDPVPEMFIPNEIMYRSVDNTVIIYSDPDSAGEPLTKDTLANSMFFKNAPEDAQILLYGAKHLHPLESVFTMNRNNDGSVRYRFNGDKCTFSSAGFTDSIFFVNPCEKQ